MSKSDILNHIFPEKLMTPSIHGSSKTTNTMRNTQNLSAGMTHHVISRGVKDIKYDNPSCQMENMQIHKYSNTKCLEDPTYAIFLVRDSRTLYMTMDPDLMTTDPTTVSPFPVSHFQPMDHSSLFSLVLWALIIGSAHMIMERADWSRASKATPPHFTQGPHLNIQFRTKNNKVCSGLELKPYIYPICMWWEWDGWMGLSSCYSSKSTYPMLIFQGRPGINLTTWLQAKFIGQVFGRRTWWGSQ